MKKTKPETAAKLTMEDNPEYVVEKLRMEKIQVEQRKVEHDFNELVFQRDNPESIKDQTMNQLLEMDPEELAAKEVLSLTGMEAINKKLAILNRKLIVLNKMLDAQKLKLGQAEGRAIRKILPGYLVEYRVLVQNMCEAIISVGDTIQAEENFRREVARIHPNLVDHMIPTTARKIGKATDRFSFAHNFLVRAMNAGHIPSSMVPEGR